LSSGAGDRADALALVDASLEDVLGAAQARRDAAWGSIITYSPKVFIPLTTLCRDVCHYCTFAHPPRRGERAYLSIDEAVAIARAGAAQGCKEALFTLGDKPELRYRAAREELAALGYPSTAAYLVDAARVVLDETGLLPHINAGVLTDEEFLALRDVSVSYGLMLETVSERLSARGMPHFGSPDKEPAVRVDALARLGLLRIPTTSGILMGLGESRLERIESLLENFRAKPGTKMAAAPEPSLEDHLWTLAVARLVLPAEISLQAPPNLAGADFPVLASSGINDWGGISSVTVDHVNPEAPWPEIDRLADASADAGYTLLPRLAIYPRYAADPETWLEPSPRAAVNRLADSLWLARRGEWMTGVSADVDDTILDGVRRTKRDDGAREHRRPRSAFSRALERSASFEPLSEDDAVALLSARGDDVSRLAHAADERRRDRNGEDVSYVVCRNINYTNVCYFRCTFCAFSKGRLAANLRGPAYLLDEVEVVRRSVEAWERGATEVCLQGGIHPGFTGEWYLGLLDAIRSALPQIHIHAFSPLEVWQGAATAGLSLDAYLEALRDAGLGSLPGTAAEILDDSIRQTLCPDKIDTQQWLEVMRIAHETGLRSTSTIMFGHIESPVHQARHLLAVRDLQSETGGFTEFVPLPFVSAEAPLALKGRARLGPTFEECVVLHAAARLILDPHITNIQASWVKLGEKGARILLDSGVNDLGGTLMNESISRAAGAAHGQECPPERMEALIAAAGRTPVQRTTLYGTAPSAQTERSFGAKPLVDSSPPTYDDSQLPRRSALVRRQSSPLAKGSLRTPV